ncbi:hypothetical protein P4393_11840 [Bacillus subtilis]|nr:hypothetical protein [Bacillus subtilis]MED3474690.1 hypothetical protein [Bacillus subtilis]
MKKDKEMLKTWSAINAINKGIILGHDLDDGIMYLRKTKGLCFEVLIERGYGLESLYEGDGKLLGRLMAGPLNNKCYIVDYPIGP